MIDMAKSAFQELNSRNVVSWCSMMQLCIRDGRLGDARRVFSKMISEGVELNEFAFSIALAACGSAGLGRQPSSAT